MEITMSSLFIGAFGILLGALIAYLFLRASWTRSWIRRTEYDLLTEQRDNAIAELSDCKIQVACRMTKEEVSQAYVSKQAYLLVTEERDRALAKVAELQKEQAQLRERITNEELHDKFVSRDAHNVLTNDLVLVKKELGDKTNQIQQLQLEKNGLLKEKQLVDEKLATFNLELEKLQQHAHQQFKNIASDLLEEKKKTFIEANKTELGNLLTPLKTDLDTFKRTIEDTRKEDIKDITSLKVELKFLHELNTQLGEEARNLATALRSDTKVQGAWGEDRLKMILEAEGLQLYIDYVKQHTFRDDETEANRRPDVILKLPGNKHLVIDSKVSLTAYVNYCNAVMPDEKQLYLKQHLKSVTDHIDLLSDKNYHTLVGLNSPDYVFMFMPIESAITLALNESYDLFDRALKRKVVLITPTTLVATLKVVRIIWQKENQVRNVEEIFRQCGALYDKFSLFVDELYKVGAGLDNASKSYREAMNRLTEGTRKGNTIIGRFEKIKKLEARTNRSIAQQLIDDLETLPEEQDESLVIMHNVNEKNVESE